MRKILLVICAILIFGCAKVSVETAKPIKVDISMRVDVYQHVVEDVASIEDQIYGSNEKKLNCIFVMDQAYADTQLDAAIANRKERMAKIEGYFAKGIIGENKDALLEIRSSGSNDIQTVINAENADRNVIYKATAVKNEIDISEMRKIFFDDHYKRAKFGYWFQIQDGDVYEWVQK